MRGSQVKACHSVFLIKTTALAGYWVGVRIPVWVEPAGRPLHGALVWRFSSLWTNRLLFDYKPWLAVVVLVILLSVACWLHISTAPSPTSSATRFATQEMRDPSWCLRIKKGRVISISAADSGPGIPSTELEEVFKPFSRPELARQRKTGGVVLGLPIVKTCVEVCGGTVECRNRSPKGLEVEIRLPAAKT